MMLDICNVLVDTKWFRSCVKMCLSPEALEAQAAADTATEPSLQLKC